MRFTATTTGAFPPSTFTSTFGLDTSTQRETIRAPSGDPRSLIKGETNRYKVQLHNLIASWGGVDTAGRIEIRTPTEPPFVILQSAPAGHIVIPCFDQIVYLGRYGLRTVNNSIGGEYSVSVFYSMMEV